MVVIKLFLSFLRVGLFAIGGAYSFIPLIEREVVEKYGWLTKTEFLDMLGAARIFPGAISIKFATYTGYKIGGIPGVIAANLGNFLGPAIFVIIIFLLYTKYKDLPHVRKAFHMIELAVFAMIIAVAFQLVKVEQLAQFKNILVVVIVFTLFIYTKIHPALIIVGAGLIGAVLP